MDAKIIITGIAILLARILDVSLGTIRTISIVQGKTKLAFLLGFCEVFIWITVISTIIGKIHSHPFLAIFYSLGFASGNAIGLFIEKKLPIGNILVRIFAKKNGKMLAQKLRESGFQVTVFYGEGLKGPVSELFIICQKKMLKTILNIVEKIEPDAFYVIEQTGIIPKRKNNYKTPSGWRSILKKK